jgi:hypothetical protein
VRGTVKGGESRRKGLWVRKSGGERLRVGKAGGKG